MPNANPLAAPIAILLATYNGSAFLREQFRSLWAQTRCDFVVLVRDDGSSDDTLAIIETERKQHPAQVRLIEDDLGRLGPARSFVSLMRHTDARYIAFCDQDDYWLPHKLDRLVNAIHELEPSLPFDTPILCCSDATVTDAELRPLEWTYYERHGFSVADGRDLALPRLLFRNFAIGATTMVNRALARRCLDVPSAAIMHDWWMALVAVSMGKAIVLKEPLILYRQHSANAVGSRQHMFPRTWDQVQAYLQRSRISAARCLSQAVAFKRHFAALPPESTNLLESFVTFAEQDRLSRALTLIRTRAFKPGLALNGLHFYACLTADLWLMCERGTMDPQRE